MFFINGKKIHFYPFFQVPFRTCSFLLLLEQKELKRYFYTRTCTYTLVNFPHSDTTCSIPAVVPRNLNWRKKSFLHKSCDVLTLAPRFRCRPGGRSYPAQRVCWWRPRSGRGPSNKHGERGNGAEGHGWVEGNTVWFSKPSDLFETERAGLVPQVQGSSTDSWRQTKWQRSSTQSAAIASAPTEISKRCRLVFWTNVTELFLVVISQRPPADFLVSHRYPAWNFPWFFFFFCLSRQQMNSSSIWRAPLLPGRLEYL